MTKARRPIVFSPGGRLIFSTATIGVLHSSSQFLGTKAVSDYRRLSFQVVHSVAAERPELTLPICPCGLAIFIGIAGDKINDQIGWGILCCLATRRTSIEQATLALTDAQGHPLPPGTDYFAATGDEQYFCGGPETVLSSLRKYVAAGVSQFNLRLSMAEMPISLAERTVRLIGEQIIPHFNGQTAE